MKAYAVKIVCKVDSDVKYTDDYNFEEVKEIKCEENLVRIYMDNGTYVSIPKEVIISLSVKYIAELEVEP